MGLLADILKVLDALVGQALCLALAPFAPRVSRPRREGPPERVLVIRPGGIGDAVLFIPMLREVRRAWPHAALDLLLERRNAGVVAETGLADRVLLYDRPITGLLPALRARYDLVIDTEQYHRLSAVVALLTRAPRRIGFATGWRRWLFTETCPYDRARYEVHGFLDLARLATGGEPLWDSEQPFYPLSPASIDAASQALAPLLGRTLVAIHPGASIPERRWPPERYAALARELAARGLGVVIVGGSTDIAAARVITRALEGLPHVDLAGRVKLADVAAVIARVAVYVSADTGVLHLAYGAGTPTVHLFGPGVLSKWGPPGARFASVRHETPCSPCTSYGYTPPCCQGMACMLGITPERVLDAVLQQLRAAERIAR